MNKFEVKMCQNRWGANVFKIVDDNHNYLHSDGAVYPCGEYWPTREQGQAVLVKFQPLHVWKHGDIMRYRSVPCMYFHLVRSPLPMVFSLDGYLVFHGDLVPQVVKDATFLFNTRDKLGDS